MQRGFTLLEVLLSVSVIGILAAVSLPVFTMYQNRSDLDIATQQVADLYRQAATYARGVNGDSQWSVRSQSNSITLYKGSDYANRDSGFDQAISLPGSVTASGLTDTSFTKAFGIPSSAGILTMTSSATNETRTITLNGKGVITY